MLHSGAFGSFLTGFTSWYRNGHIQVVFAGGILFVDEGLKLGTV